MAKKMGRPKIKIDENQFEALCGVQCTEVEIADFFDCSVDTIENWCKETYGETFSDIFKKKSSYGKISLRRTQFRLADKSVPMAIFLGKQYLGQKDVVEENHNINNGVLDELVGAMNNVKKSR